MIQYRKSAPSKSRNISRQQRPGIEISPDGKNLFVSNAGINSISIYDIDQETGISDRDLPLQSKRRLPENH